jgi:catecholate siderophore receptor
MRSRKQKLFEALVLRWNWTNRRRLHLARVLLAGAIGTAALPSWAEEDPTLLPAVSTVTASSPETAVPGDVPLDEVVVTGEKGVSSPKYTEPLRDIPQTISVIPQEVMKEQGATTLRDVLRNVPGISIQAGEGGVPLGDNLSIRGFAARTDLFVDGVRDFGGYSRDPFSVEQVEVTKGPSSAVSGRGSTGGSVNMVSKAPRLDSSNDVSLRFGNEKNRRLTLDVNRTLSTKKGMAFRLNALSHDAEVPGRDVTREKRWGVAPSIAFGLGTPTRVTVGYLRLDQDNIPDYGLPWVTDTHNVLAAYRNGPPPVDYSNYYGLKARDFEKVTTDVATVKVEKDLGAATLRNLTRWGRTDRLSIVTAPRFVNASTTSLTRQLQDRDQVDEIAANQTDVLLNIQTGGVGHAVAAGVEIVREKSIRYRLRAPAAPTADLFQPNPDAAFGGPVTRSGEKDDGVSDSLAFYAVDTIKLGDRWEFPVGVRWDRFKLDFQDGPTNGAGQTLGLSRTDRLWSGRLAVVFKPSARGSVYAGLGTSFNPASEGLILSLSTTSANNASLDPEKSITWEAGSKWDLFKAFSLGAAVFRTEKLNARTPSLIPNEPNVLDGKQRVEGVELSASGNPVRWWSLYASAVFLRSEVLVSNLAGEAGLELSNTPRQSYSLWTSARLPRRVELGAGVQAVGSRFTSTTPATRRQAPGYSLLSAMVAWHPVNDIAFRLNVDNLADKTYIDRVGGGHFIPGPGRLVALTTDVSF